MKNNRREFIRKSTAMAALSVAGLSSATSELLGSSADQSQSSRKMDHNQRNISRMQELKCVLPILPEWRLNSGKFSLAGS